MISWLREALREDRRGGRGDFVRVELGSRLGLLLDALPRILLWHVGVVRDEHLRSRLLLLVLVLQAVRVELVEDEVGQFGRQRRIDFDVRILFFLWLGIWQFFSKRYIY